MSKWKRPFAGPPKAASSDAAITALVEQYASALYSVAYSVLRNQAEAEDAVQEVFLRVLKHRHNLSGIRNKRTWLVRLVWNVAIDRTRRRKTHPETEDVADYARVLPSANLDVDAEVIGSEERSHILALIDKLPAKERKALLLSAVEELSTEEIAATLRTSKSSVRSRIFRARRLLAAMIEAENDPCGLLRSHRRNAA